MRDGRDIPLPGMKIEPTKVVLLECQERMTAVEEWWNSLLKGDYVWVTYFKHRSVHN